MNYRIICEAPDTLLIVTTEGKMNAVDFLTMATALLRHPCYLPGRDVIFDHRTLEFEHVDLGELEKIRAFHREHEKQIGGGRSAIVVKTGLKKDWEQLWSQGEKIKTANRVQVFEDYADAAKWLKMTP